MNLKLQGVMQWMHHAYIDVILHVFIQGLEIKFLNMSLELSEQCKSDYVEVIRQSDGEVLGVFCGNQVTNYPLSMNYKIN